MIRVLVGAGRNLRSAAGRTRLSVRAAHADLPGLRRRIARAPAAGDLALVEDEPLHRDQLVCLAGRLLTPERGDELPLLEVARRHGVAFGGEVLDRQLDRKGVVQLAPD